MCRISRARDQTVPPFPLVVYGHLSERASFLLMRTCFQKQGKQWMRKPDKAKLKGLMVIITNHSVFKSSMTVCTVMILLINQSNNFITSKRQGNEYTSIKFPFLMCIQCFLGKISFLGIIRVIYRFVSDWPGMDSVPALQSASLSELSCTSTHTLNKHWIATYFPTYSTVKPRKIHRHLSFSSR